MNTIATAANQYANRPADERYPSVDALIAAALDRQNHSREVDYNLKDLSVVPEGQSLRLQSPKGQASFTHWAFGQFSRLVGAPAAYLRSLPSDIAAQALNYGIKSSPAGTTAKILAQLPNGNPTPTIRACTTDSYARVWSAPMYDAIKSSIMDRSDKWSLPPTWSGEPAGAYMSDRDDFLIITHGGSIVTDPSLSNSPILGTTHGSSGTGTGGQYDGMYRGLMIRNSEVGAAAISIQQIYFRYICGNHMLWGAVIGNSFKRRHIGTALRETVREIGRIAYDWTNASAARDEAIIASLIKNQLASSKEAIIDELHKMGATKSDAEKAYDLAEQREHCSPRSFWGIAQGLTRLSQEQSHGYQDDRLMLDLLAAKVLARGNRVASAA